jgi:hypothetical protein
MKAIVSVRVTDIVRVRVTLIVRIRAKVRLRAVGVGLVHKRLRVRFKVSQGPSPGPDYRDTSTRTVVSFWS